MTQHELVHRALSSPVRARLVDLLRADDRPWAVQELAGRLDLHANTVRAHLAVLEEAGLVSAEPETRSRPGRPRHLFRATDAAATASRDGEHRLLAQILASYLAGTADDPSAAAEEAGTAWGRHLVDPPDPFQQLPPSEAIDRLVDLLEAHGFAPELDDAEPETPRVLLRRCPFLDTAREHPEVVCAVHLGLMRGALDALGVEVVARDLQPFVQPDLCVSHLEMAP